MTLSLLMLVLMPIIAVILTPAIVAGAMWRAMGEIIFALANWR